MKSNRLILQFIFFISPWNIAFAAEHELKLLFSAKHSILSDINASIDRARVHIRFAASKLSNKRIVKSLNLASSRGVIVQIIVDSSTNIDTKSQLAFLAKNGACIYFDGTHKTFHNKYIIIDDSMVITGSYNFTRDSEEKNAENVVIIYSTQSANEYLDDWRFHLMHAVHSNDSHSSSRCKIPYLD